MRPKTIPIALLAAVTLVFICPAAVQSGPPADSWRWVHPDARVIIGMDLVKARASATGRMLERQMGAGTAQWKSSGPLAGLWSRIDRILISSTNMNQQKADTVVVLLEGRLPRADVRKLAPVGTALERFQGIDLLVPPRAKADEMLVALVSERQLLMGTRATLGAVLGARPGDVDEKLVTRARLMAADSEFWVVGNKLDEDGGKGSPLGDVESIDFSVKLAKGLGLTASLMAKDENSAKAMATMLQMGMAMMAQNKGQTPEMTALLRGLDVTTEGTAVRLKMDVPLAVLEKGIQQTKLASAQGGRKSLESMLGIHPSGEMPAGLRPVVRPSPPPPEPSGPKVIRVYGAEGGTMEIPYSAKP